MHTVFQDLKAPLQAAPALGLPDYTQKFHLHVCERDGFASGILVQGRITVLGRTTRLLLSPVLGMPGCLRSMAAVAIMIDKSVPAGLSSDCVVLVPHSVPRILEHFRHTTHDSCTSSV